MVTKFTTKIDTKKGTTSTVEVEIPSFIKYSNLPEGKEGQIEYVETTTDLNGFRKHAGWYMYEDGKWKLLEKVDAE